MKIREWIIRAELKNVRERVEKLKELEAPDIMIESLDAEIEELSHGKIKIGGEQALLDTEYTSHEVRKGNGGKVYVHFDNGINYFPTARYGRFITKGE